MPSRYRNHRRSIPRQLRLRSIRRQALAVALGFLAVVLGTWQWREYSATLESEQAITQTRLQAIVRALGGKISADDVAMLSELYLTETGTSGEMIEDPAYQKLQRQLQNAQGLFGLDTPVYVLVASSKIQDLNFARFVATSAPRTVPGRRIPLTPEVRIRFAKGGVIDRVEDDYGLWVSAFHPVRAADGRTVGIIQADQNFEAQEDSAKRSLLDGLAACVILWLSVALVLNRLGSKAASQEQRLFERWNRARERARRHETLSEAKTQVTAEIAREFRSPLNAVVGINEFLLEGHLDPEQRQLARTIDHSSQRLLGVLTELSTHVEMQQDRLHLERTEFSLVELMQDFELRWATVAADCEQTFVFHMPSRLPNQVVADRIRFEQIFELLMENAFFHVDLGSVEVTVSRKSQSNRWAELAFDIHDTGTGVPEKLLKRPAETLATKLEPKLRRYVVHFAISKFLIRALGGSLEYRVNESGGGHYSFSLPFAVSTEAYTPDAVELEAMQMSGVHVLIAEDDPAIQRLISTLLDRWNCSYRIAEHGDRAVHLARSESFDLILMDIAMPILNGIDATRRIREFERNQRRTRTRIVALTAQTSEEDRRACRAAGADLVIAKPFHAAELQRVVFHSDQTVAKPVAV